MSPEAFPHGGKGHAKQNLKRRQGNLLRKLFLGFIFRIDKDKIILGFTQLFFGGGMEFGLG